MPVEAGAAIALKVFQALYEAMEYLKKLNNPDPATIRELYNRLNGIESDVRMLEVDVANLTYEIRRGQVIDLIRDIDAQRADFSAALIFSADHPGDTASELTALSASLALSKPSFYTFPGRTINSPDRFDPRAALPSFVEAVGTWVAIHRFNKSPWTDSSRTTLRTFATILEGMINRIRDSVVCVEKYTSFDQPIIPTKPKGPRRKEDPPPPPPPPETVPKCNHAIYLVDSTIEETIWFKKETLSGYCNKEGQWTDPVRAKKYLDQSFQPDKLAEVAAYWRLVATSPN